MKIFVTGAAGYIGGMLVDQLLKDARVTQVVALDMRDDPLPPNASDPRRVWITHNLGDEGWQKLVLRHGVPDVVIHCAYVIREGYGAKRAWQNKCNITAAEKLFAFVFANHIARLIHFSSVATYGALSTNTIARRFVETDPLREANYLYGVDKALIEERLRACFAQTPTAQVVVFRPCAISGPRGQYQFKRFGLLQMVKHGLPIVPITGAESARQFIHEDDVADAVAFATFGGVAERYAVFNLAPQGFFLLKDMVRTIHKWSLRIPMFLGYIGFAFLWHVSRGRIPTVPAGIRSYTYPIIVDGSKLDRAGFHYRYDGAQALAARVGRYASAVQQL